MLAQMGYDGLFLGRIDYQDKVHRLTNRNAEVVWHASDSLGNKADMFTGVLYNTYSPPPGFCFDILCSDEPIVDDKSSPEYNVDRKVNFILYFSFYIQIFFSFEIVASTDDRIETNKKNIKHSVIRIYATNIVGRIFRFH